MINPPVAKKVPHEITTHGDTRIDQYYWMRDMERKDPEIISHLEAENTYTKERLKHTDSLQKELFNELKGRIKQTDESVPYFYDGFWYYTRFEEGNEYPIFCRKAKTMEAAEEAYLDVNELAKGYSFYQVGGMSLSTNNNLVAFAEDTISRRIYTIQIKDLTTGNLRDDKIEGSTGNCVWANDTQTLV